MVYSRNDFNHNIKEVSMHQQGFIYRGMERIFHMHIPEKFACNCFYGDLLIILLVIQKLFQFYSSLNDLFLYR